MSQYSILSLLECRRDEWLSAGVLKELLGVDNRNVFKQLASLRKYDEVYFVRYRLFGRGFVRWSYRYRYKKT